ncbi:hypothetical protein [Streptomyces sp. NPDC059166]
MRRALTALVISATAVAGFMATAGPASAASETRWGCKAKFYAMDVD